MAEIDISQFLGGYTPNPAATAAYEAEIARTRPVALRHAAPDMMAYGQAGDLKPYLAYYEVEILNPDGTVWKPKGEEPAYEAQTGNNCTAKSTANALDLLQCIDASEGKATVYRACNEAIYAFGLATAGMSGDNGCYGSSLAKAINTIGTVSYREVGAPYKEDRSRLLSFARSPRQIVEKYRTQAAAFKADDVVKITEVEEACAWIANRGIILLASTVGFATSVFPLAGPAPRDARGIVRAAGRWPHQMWGGGVIRSDGTDTIVFFQSWGKNVPSGPTPFQLPTFAFRVTFSDFARVLAGNDCWGVRALHNFSPLTPTPLPDRWTWSGWLGV